MNARLNTIIVLIVVLIGLVGGYVYWTHSKQETEIRKHDTAKQDAYIADEEFKLKMILISIAESEAKLQELKDGDPYKEKYRQLAEDERKDYDKRMHDLNELKKSRSDRK